MKTNAIVILFPELDFLGTRKSCFMLFNECIKKRYLNLGYKLIVVRYKGYRENFTGGIINIPVDKIIDADITSNEQLKKYADFEKLAHEIAKLNHEQIVIGGFHCFDCVEKLAKEVYKLNKNVLIDSDLTEKFDFVSRYYKNWEIDKFKPELKIEDSLHSFENSSLDLLQKILERYTHPIWGIDNKYIEKLKKDIVYKQNLKQDTSIKN